MFSILRKNTRQLDNGELEHAALKDIFNVLK